MQKIRKAIIPAAGFGTRFLPQTKAMPKEMLPIIDKPVIQYVVEEAVAAGITDVIIVTGMHKRAIEDHFDQSKDLEAKLIADGKQEMAGQLRKISEMANFVYLRHKGPVGNGIPIVNASHLVSDEPFLVLWGDDFCVSQKPRALQLVEEYEKTGKSVIALMQTTADMVNQYGIVEIKAEIADDSFQIGGLVEKPAKDQAPSLYASIGGYVLTPDILPILAAQKPDQTGEVYLSTAIDALARSSTVYGKVIEGNWHDTGNKEKYLEAIVDTALSDPKVSRNFAKYLSEKLK